jgi:hypothetical protein
MKMFFTLLIISIATTCLLTANRLLSLLDVQIHPNNFINGLAKYQVYALIVSLIAALVTIWLNLGDRALLGVGDLQVIAEKEKWLGINGRSTWRSNGLQLLLFISLATGIFMFLGLQYTDSLHTFQWSFVPWVLLFSATNALSEELIFRFCLIAGLNGEYSKLTILVLSAILFGLPHYYGNPGGPVGVIMSGVLGYILCKASVETKGLSIAWGIHFVQDVIIFLAVMMMNIRN